MSRVENLHVGRGGGLGDLGLVELGEQELVGLTIQGGLGFQGLELVLQVGELPLLASHRRLLGADLGQARLHDPEGRPGRLGELPTQLGDLRPDRGHLGVPVAQAVLLEETPLLGLLVLDVLHQGSDLGRGGLGELGQDGVEIHHLDSGELDDRDEVLEHGALPTPVLELARQGLGAVHERTLPGGEVGECLGLLEVADGLHGPGELGASRIQPFVDEVDVGPGRKTDPLGTLLPQGDARLVQHGGHDDRIGVDQRNVDDVGVLTGSR